jgi:hypothetical protein
MGLVDRLRDKLYISCELYDVASRQLIAASTFRRVGTGFTFVSGTPDRYMNQDAQGALGRMYGWTSK